MSTITPDAFFRCYEQANNDFDIQVISKLYADVFMFGNAQGVRAVKKDDFLKVLPRRKEFMKAAGLLSSRVDSVESSRLDSKYTLVKTVWDMRFQVENRGDVSRKTSATYILSTTADACEIVFQLDHQDLMEIVQDLRKQS